ALIKGRLTAELPNQLAAELLVQLAPRPSLGPTLFVLHEGRRYPVTQDEFLIGRDSATVHLAIEDGMVSRHHAAVIRRNGKHYIKDLGSTQGITYKGMQIDNKRIDEGDVFEIGGHQLRFTFEA
ncbi:MAG TPA: FHA domain-containing protein, partial [Kofleriaceae bacterium]